MDLNALTLTSFHKGFTDNSFSALDVTQGYLNHIKDADGDIHAYLSVFSDEAVRMAEDADLALNSHARVTPLTGAPIAIKDNILIQGTTTTAASRILEHYTAAYDATVIRNLREHKAVFLGKTNLDEFAMGSSTENSAFGTTKNPHDLERVPGGSSGGSTAAVASGEALAALGSDTGGSIRQPAAFCGVVGLKPSYGAVSRHGVMAMASSLDQIGPITKTVDDAATLFAVLQGKDSFDATSRDVNVARHNLDRIRSLRVGIPREYFTDGLRDDVAQGIEAVRKRFESFKLSFHEVSLPHTQQALPCYYIIMPAEVSSNLARLDGIRYSRISDAAKRLQELYVDQRSKGFGTEAQRRILLGTFVLSSGYYDAYYGKAQQVRRLIQRDFDSVFENVDVLLTPTTPTPAFKIGEKIDDPVAMYLSDVFTVPASLAGLPALAVPVADRRSDEGLPLSFQLIGKRYHESDILSLGSYYEATS